MLLECVSQLKAFDFDTHHEDAVKRGSTVARKEIKKNQPPPLMEKMEYDETEPEQQQSNNQEESLPMDEDIDIGDFLIGESIGVGIGDDWDIDQFLGLYSEVDKENQPPI